MSVKLDESITAHSNYLVITETKALITEIELEAEPSGTSHGIKNITCCNIFQYGWTAYHRNSRKFTIRFFQ